MADSAAVGVAHALAWEQAHVGFERAVAALPAGMRGVRPAGAPHSAWELVEHIRIAQADLLAYATDPAYRAPPWPDAYWPPSPAPPSDQAWSESVAAVVRDRSAIEALLADGAVEPTARIPWAAADHHTYLRTALLALDHAAYHVGQLVLVRRMLGAWPPEEAP